MMIFGKEIALKLIAMIVGGIILIGIILFGLNECRARQTADKQAEVSSEQGQASINAGATAINTVSNIASNDAATDASVAQGQSEIRSAPEGQKGKATRNAACRLKAYRDTPECKEPPK
jgi:FtsZ-interacting cell division protein ZipA